MNFSGTQLNELPLPIEVSELKRGTDRFMLHCLSGSLHVRVPQGLADCRQFISVAG